MGVPNNKLECFKEERFRDSLRKQLQGGKTVIRIWELRMMNVSYLVWQEQKPRNYCSLLHLLLFCCAAYTLEHLVTQCVKRDIGSSSCS